MTKRARRPVGSALVTLALAAAGGALAATPAQASVPGPLAQSAGVRYVAPVASGRADGSSWANAATLARLPALVTAAGSGGQVLLRADAGPYTTPPIALYRGGSTGAPVTIRGVATDGTAMPAVVVGNRVSPYAANGRSGDEVFRLMAGASHLRFSDLRFSNVGTVVRIAGDVSDITVEHVSASNVRHFLDDTAGGTALTATVDHLTLSDVTVSGFSKGVVRLRYDTHDVLLQDVTGDSQQQDGDNFAMGVHLDGTAHDITLRRVAMSNALDTTHPYWNGDGFTVESQVHDVLFDHTTSAGNSDAGYDIKGSHITMTSVTSRDNKKNLRVWGTDVRIADCLLLDPHKRGGTSDQTQVWLSDTARASATNCTIADNSPATVVFGVGTGSNLTMTGGSVVHATAGPLRRGPSTATVMLSGQVAPSSLGLGASQVR